MWIGKIGQKSAAFINHKPFHPGNWQNQEKIWLAEQKHKEELKKQAELAERREEEMKIQELRRALYSQGYSKSSSSSLSSLSSSSFSSSSGLHGNGAGVHGRKSNLEGHSTRAAHELRRKQAAEAAARRAAEIRRKESMVASTLYTEDVKFGTHGEVWGSFFDRETRRWGFACCRCCERQQLHCPAAPPAASTSQHLRRKRKKKTPSFAISTVEEQAAHAEKTLPATAGEEVPVDREEQTERGREEEETAGGKEEEEETATGREEEAEAGREEVEAARRGREAAAGREEEIVAGAEEAVSGGTVANGEGKSEEEKCFKRTSSTTISSRSEIVVVSVREGTTAAGREAGERNQKEKACSDEERNGLKEEEKENKMKWESESTSNRSSHTQQRDAVCAAGDPATASKADTTITLTRDDEQEATLEREEENEEGGEITCANRDVKKIRRIGVVDMGEGRRSESDSKVTLPSNSRAYLSRSKKEEEEEITKEGKAAESQLVIRQRTPAAAAAVVVVVGVSEKYHDAYDWHRKTEEEEARGATVLLSQGKVQHVQKINGGEKKEQEKQDQLRKSRMKRGRETGLASVLELLKEERAFDDI